MITAVIVAGGKGKRMGQDVNKQYIKINDKEILAITLEKFQNAQFIDEIIVVVGQNEIEFCSSSIVKKYNFTKVKRIAAGGEERQKSVYNGLLACSEQTDIVVIHDGARPFITEEVIARSIEGAREFGACTVGVPVKDTIKIVDYESFITNTPDRRKLIAVQTPQTFKYELILSAHWEYSDKNISFTDDTMLAEAMGHRVKVIEGSYFNFKLTTPEDLILGEAVHNYLCKNGGKL